MEIAKLVLEYVKALVWPLVTITLVWGLRSHIHEAMRRMIRLDTVAGAIEFAEDARTVREQVEELADTRPALPPDSSTEPEQTHEVDPDQGPDSRQRHELTEPLSATAIRDTRADFGPFTSAMTLAGRSPASAVTEAWLFLRSAIIQAGASRAVASFDVYVRDKEARALRDVLQRLRPFGLSGPALMYFEQLDDLQRQAAMGTQVSPRAAEDFIMSCYYFYNDLMELAPDPEQPT
ncbi:MULTISPECIES: hypothetical protein [unclassified Streptomyces]|uniref:hypothetical protein n=1 Tax=unclassified Streptomyces TaxID=2593676 RepID=UPI00093E5D29|nr:hypothetical protein [Streptomyces sp. TSRI0281]OKI35056.1 hypothetical protein A6A29_16690 [Streptomyces sp. TSRI0281]